MLPQGALDWTTELVRQHGDVKLPGSRGQVDVNVIVTEESVLYSHLQTVLLHPAKLVFRSDVAGFRPFTYRKSALPGGELLVIMS